MFGSLIQRQSRPTLDRAENMMGAAGWRDVQGIDSAYDYDPVWAESVECGIAPTFHSASHGIGLRLSPSNFVYNHIGHFGVAGEAVCKALFLGGVTWRFPELKFALLEGGVGCACQLNGDLIEQLEAVAQLIHLGSSSSKMNFNRQIFFVNFGNFDTHGNQAEEHPILLRPKIWKPKNCRCARAARRGFPYRDVTQRINRGWRNRRAG